MRIIAVLWLSLSALAYAGGKPTGGAALGGGEMQKPLEVKGQTRNITMMVVNQAEKDKLKFVTARKDFHDQIVNTKY